MSAASQAAVSCESGAGTHGTLRCERRILLHRAITRWFTPTAQTVGVFLSGMVGGGESGIRTHDALIAHTRSPGVRLRPLGHLSAVARFYSGQKESPPAWAGFRMLPDELRPDRDGLLLPDAVLARLR